MSEFIYIDSARPMQTPMILKSLNSKIVQSKLLSRLPYQIPRRLSKRKSINLKLLCTSSATTLSVQQQNDLNPHLQFYIKKKAQKRFNEQLKIATNLQKVFMTQQYQIMKNKLQSYARSKKNKIQTLMSGQKQNKNSEFNKENNDKQFKQFQNKLKSQSLNVFNESKSLQYVEISRQKLLSNSSNNCRHQYKKIAKKSFLDNNVKLLKKILQNQEKQNKIKSSSIQRKPVENDHIVVLDQKYNSQFAIKLATIIQAEDRRILKQRHLQRKQNLLHNKSPLVIKSNNIINFTINKKKSNSTFEQFNRVSLDNYKKQSLEDLGITFINKRQKSYKPLKKTYKLFIKTQQGFYQTDNKKQRAIHNLSVYKNMEKYNSNPLLNNMIRVKLSANFCLSQQNNQQKRSSRKSKSTIISTPYKKERL